MPNPQQEGKMRKYKFTGETKIEFGITFKRIQSIMSFGVIKKGELGGWIEDEKNLSPDAQVSGDAWVSGNARVSGNALVSGDAQVSGDAWVSGNARVSGDAWVSGNARVSGNAQVSGNALVSGDAQVSGDAWVSGNARVSGNALVSGNAQVSGNARVSGDARVSVNALVSGNAWVYGQVHLKFGLFTSDCKADLRSTIAASLNVFPLEGAYTLYKRVKKTAPSEYVSCYDSTFTYRDGEKKMARNPDMDWAASCSSGLHASTPSYTTEGDTLIAVKVELTDIITCQEGKVRCKALTVIGEVKS